MARKRSIQTPENRAVHCRGARPILTDYDAAQYLTGLSVPRLRRLAREGVLDVREDQGIELITTASLERLLDVLPRANQGAEE